MVYDNLPSVGFCPAGVAMLGNKIPMKAVKCPFYQGFISSGLSESSPLVMENATMRVVVPNRKNVEKSLAKCNVLPVYPDDALQTYVEGLVDEYLGPLLRTTTLLPDQAVKFNMETSPSLTWRSKGCKSKRDAFAHPQFAAEVSDCTHVPLVDYCGKTEFLDIEEILTDGKIRGFFNPPLDFNVKQKILFENQNLSIKSACDRNWIKYGFVKQYGGFDRLAKSLLKFDMFGESDCTGYDRHIFLMYVYMRRIRFLKYTILQYGMLCYVFAFILYSFVICPDGVIRMRQTGNDSGRNNTTVDNSMAHIPILFRFCCRLWLASRFRRLPSLDEILTYHSFCVYSDDAFAAHCLSYLDINIDTYGRIAVEVYREFGLTLKPKQTLYTLRTVEGRMDPRHSFLGSYFYWSEECETFVPYPRIQKICSSLFYKEKGLSNDLIIIRTLALMILSAPEPWLYQELSRFLDFLLDTIPHSIDLLSESWISTIEAARLRPELWFVSTLGR